MDAKKDHFERAVGDSFVHWYNQQFGTNFAFLSQQEDPGLTYHDGDRVLHVEVTSAYYDDRHAKLLWQNARGVPNVPKDWGGVSFGKALASHINGAIARKCGNDYGRDCVLVIYVAPILTGADELEELLTNIALPDDHRFAGIYLAGDFPSTSTDQGGYRCWRLDR